MSPLRVRNFRLLFLARTISFFGTNLVPIAVAFAILDLGGSATAVGLAFAARTLAQVSTLMVGGVVADRFSRRLVMIASDTANLVVQTAMGALLLLGHAEIWQLVALQAAGGAAAAFHSPASTALVPETVAPEQLQGANGYMTVARYSATIAGAAGAGALVAIVGSGWAILLDGATYASSALLLAAIRLPSARRRLQSPRFVRELVDGWREFTAHTFVWLLTAFVALFFLFSYAPFFVLGPAISQESMNGAAGWATVLTGEAVGALAGGLVALRVRPKRPMFLVALLFPLDGLQLALLAERAPLPAVAAAAAVAGFNFAFATVLFETEVQRRVAPDKLSRVSAFNWLTAMCVLPLGYALAGPIADAVGAATSLWFGAVWVAVSAVAVAFVPAVRYLGRDEAPDGVPLAARP